MEDASYDKEGEDLKPVEPKESFSRKETKGLKRYIFEFTLVFLAVLLGFLADNFRESLANKAKERENISSLIQNLKDDSRRLSELITQNEWKQTHLDSIDLLRPAFLSKSSRLKNIASHIFLGYCCSFIFRSNDATITQLKN